MKGIASSGTSGKKSSRLLAALDGPSTLFDMPHAGTKHPLDTPPGPQIPGPKRRATRKSRDRADSPDSPTPDTCKLNPFCSSLCLILFAVDVDNLIQLAGLPSTQSKSTPGKIISGDFSIRYDVETEVRAIDRGGTDQAIQYVPSVQFDRERVNYMRYISMAEFVTKAIDNVAHGLSVQKAMEYLGLEECVTISSIASKMLIEFAVRETSLQGWKCACCHIK